MTPLEAINQGYSLRQVRHQWERKLILQILKQVEWNINKAATKLVLTRQGLNKKILQYDLPKEFPIDHPRHPKKSHFHFSAEPLIDLF
jgi:DNA-binding NtrC family response regulator